MDHDPISRRMNEQDLGEAEHAQLAALRRLAYHEALMGILGGVRRLVAAVEQADHAYATLGLPSDAELSEEERALFATSQLMLVRLVKAHPGAALLFPPLEPEPPAAPVQE